MKNERDRLKSDSDSEAQAKRRDREGPNPGGQPGEFADDMRVNRDTPPPAPRVDEEK